ncbi:MAG TPA: DUF4093 domain-containing protein [Ruminococcaceae bacterium]|nr:DUF4093 domain-containing protein [Oscillospiraceae bacterium]
MIRVREAIVVEGKYDKIKLASVVDALVIETNGFGIFKDRQLMELIRLLARERGLLILTDSDSAGFVIRDYLSGAIPPEQIKHAYIPNLSGKERRKNVPSKEGFLGVEGVDGSTIANAIRNAGATIEDESAVPQSQSPLTKMDLYETGLVGREFSATRRRQLLGLLGLPKSLSANRLVAVLNMTMTRKRFGETLRDLGWIEYEFEFE